jgi:hypothetical protein
LRPAEPDRAPPNPANDRAQLTVVRDHRDVAVVVGAQQRHAEHGHLVEQHWRRMAVVVVHADADNREAGVHRSQEVRVGVGRAVVRHLEHVDAQVGPGVEKRLLGLDLGVAREHDPDAVDIGHQHERGVIRVGARAVERGWRTEHLQVDRADL